MRVRMIGTHKGSPDGININEYRAGEKYDIPVQLAEIFLNAEWAEEDKEEKQEEKHETKTDRPADRRAGKSRRGKAAPKS